MSGSGASLLGTNNLGGGKTGDAILAYLFDPANGSGLFGSNQGPGAFMNPTGQGGALYPGGPGLPGGNATGKQLNNLVADYFTFGAASGGSALGGGGAAGGDVAGAGSLADSGSALPAYGAPIGSLADYANASTANPSGAAMYGAPIPSLNPNGTMPGTGTPATPSGVGQASGPAQLAQGGPSNAQPPGTPNAQPQDPWNTALASGAQTGQIYLEYLAESKLKAQPGATDYAPPHNSASGQTTALSLAPGGGFSIPSQY